MRIYESNIKKWEDFDEINVTDEQGNSYKIDMQALVDEVQRARIGLCHLYPAFTDFVNQLEIVYTFQVDTMATDGHHIFINPLFTQLKLPTLTDKAFVIAHEVMHCVLSHIRRAKQLGWDGSDDDHEKCNIAADYEVNITLCEMGVFSNSAAKKLKNDIGILYDEKYAQWGFENIYR